MADGKQKSGNGPSDEGSAVVVLEVPPDRSQEVIDFVSNLRTDEAEVTGHMISRGVLGGGMIGATQLTTKTGHNCWETGKQPNVDVQCAKSDTIESP